MLPILRRAFGDERDAGGMLLRPTGCLAIDPEIPIGFNAEFNEYYLKTFDDGNILFTYCPSCGGTLPKSRRGEFFTEPSTTEMIQLRAKLESATSIDEVLKLLGEPDERYGPIVSDSGKKEIYGMRGHQART